MYLIVWCVMVGVILAYLALATLINRRVKFHHEAVWNELGRPSFFNNSVANNFRFAGFFLFSGRYKSLSDQTMNYYVFCARLLLMGAAALFIWLALNLPTES